MNIMRIAAKYFFVMTQGRAHLISEEKVKEKGYVFNHNNNNVPSVNEGHKLLYQKCQKYARYKKVGIGQYYVIIKLQIIMPWKNE